MQIHPTIIENIKRTTGDALDAAETAIEDYTPEQLTDPHTDDVLIRTTLFRALGILGIPLGSDPTIVRTEDPTLTDLRAAPTLVLLTALLTAVEQALTIADREPEHPDPTSETYRLLKDAETAAIGKDQARSNALLNLAQTYANIAREPITRKSPRSVSPR